MDAITCGNVGGALNWNTLPVWPKRGARAHRFALFRSEETRPSSWWFSGTGWHRSPHQAESRVTITPTRTTPHDEEGGHAAATPDA